VLYRGWFIGFFARLSARVGGNGRAAIIVLLWFLMCVALLFAGAAVGLSDPENPVAGLVAAALGLLSISLFIAGPYLARAWFWRRR
jgi:hypothetical protein